MAGSISYTGVRLAYNHGEIVVSVNLLKASVVIYQICQISYNLFSEAFTYVKHDRTKNLGAASFIHTHSLSLSAAAELEGCLFASFADTNW